MSTSRAFLDGTTPVLDGLPFEIHHFEDDDGCEGDDRGEHPPSGRGEAPEQEGKPVAVPRTPTVGISGVLPSVSRWRNAR